MCGKCTILVYDEVLQIVREIAEENMVAFEADAPVRRSLAFPKSVAPLITPTFDTLAPSPALDQGTLDVRELSWGFVESWKPGVVFNTRIESAVKPMWRDSMEHRRCVLPVTSFFETSREETYPSPKTGRPIKRQYEFCVPGQSVIFIGCVWRGDAFSMVTTEANEDMAPIHHRMPVVVRQEELPLWLGPGYQQLADRSSIRLESRPAD